MLMYVQQLKKRTIRSGDCTRNTRTSQDATGESQQELPIDAKDS